MFLGVRRKQRVDFYSASPIFRLKYILFGSRGPRGGRMERRKIPAACDPSGKFPVFNDLGRHANCWCWFLNLVSDKYEPIKHNNLPGRTSDNHHVSVGSIFTFLEVRCCVSSWNRMISVNRVQERWCCSLSVHFLWYFDEATYLYRPPAKGKFMHVKFRALIGNLRKLKNVQLQLL